MNILQYFHLFAFVLAHAKEAVNNKTRLFKSKRGPFKKFLLSVQRLIRYQIYE